MRYLVVCALVLISACASSGTNQQPQNGVRVATADMVGTCKLVGDVFGTSSLYGLAAERGMARARAEAFHKVELLGGNTVVWTQIAPVHGATSVSGNAYACPN